MHNVEYTDDNKFLTVPKYTGAELHQVPVALIDELLERELFESQITALKAFRRVTRHASFFEWVKIKDLVDVDLTNSTAYIYDANWEDSEWLSTSIALTVKESDYDNYYEFVFEKTEEENYNRLDGASFYALELILIVRQ